MLRSLISFASWTLVAVSCLSFIPFLPWPFRLFVHFQWQLFFLTGFFTVITMLARKVVVAGGLALVCLFHLATVAPDFTAKPEQTGPGDGPTYRLVSFNVNIHFDNFSAFKQFVAREKPDIIALQETTPAWQVTFSELSEAYPYSEHVQKDAYLGVTLLSRLPCTFGHADLARESSVMLWATCRANKDAKPPLFTVTNQHVYPGYWPNTLDDRRQFLNAAAKWLRKVDTPALAVGDFNMTPYSQEFRDFTQESALRDSRAGFGVQPSWPSFFTPLLLAIDHVFVSRSLNVLDRRRGPSMGSDHYPVIVDFAAAE